jgi:hypothetical protein
VLLPDTEEMQTHREGSPAGWARVRLGGPVVTLVPLHVALAGPPCCNSTFHGAVLEDVRVGYDPFLVLGAHPGLLHSCGLFLSVGSGALVAYALFEFHILIKCFLFFTGHVTVF